MGHIYTALYVLLAVAVTFALVRPCYRIFAPKVRLPATSELVGIVAFLLMLAPLSALLISVLSLPLLAGLGWVLGAIAPQQLAAIRTLADPFPAWVPFLLLFAIVYLAVFLNGLLGYVKSGAVTHGEHG